MEFLNNIKKKYEKLHYKGMPDKNVNICIVLFFNAKRDKF